MSRKEELKKEIDSLRNKLLDNSKAIDAETRQLILDSIRADKKELAEIDSEERRPNRTVSTVTDVPTGRTVVKNTNNSNRRTIIGDGNSMNSFIRMGVR